MLIRTIFVTAAASLALVAVIVPRPAGAADPPQETTRSVTVTVDFGDGFQKRYTAVPWREKMTVFAATEAASKHKRGFRFASRGRGATAFLTSIDDLKNESGGRGWLYRVNGKRGDRSCATFPVGRGDVILWEFTNY